MSATHAYVNHDKAQWFRCGIFGRRDDFHGIGRGPGARALGILLSDRGTWIGDHISIISDFSAAFERLYVTATNIDVEVELMLIDVDGLDWIERDLDSYPIMFRQMCAFATLLRRKDIIDMLNAKYGIGKWQRRYERELQGNTDLWSQSIIDAAQRNLKLLA